MCAVADHLDVEPPLDAERGFRELERHVGGDVAAAPLRPGTAEQVVAEEGAQQVGK